MLQLLKTLESEKPADVGTKDVAEKDMKRSMINIGLREKTGRHLKALRTAVGAGSTALAQEDGEGLSQLTALD